MLMEGLVISPRGRLPAAAALHYAWRWLTRALGEGRAAALQYTSRSCQKKSQQKLYVADPERVIAGD